MMIFSQIENIKNGEKLRSEFITAFKCRICYPYCQPSKLQKCPTLQSNWCRKKYWCDESFFKVDDVYESYINIATGLPSHYVRNVSEGGYKRHFETDLIMTIKR
jgi:hypothetical protein